MQPFNARWRSRVRASPRALLPNAAAAGPPPTPPSTSPRLNFCSGPEALSLRGRTGLGWLRGCRLFEQDTSKMGPVPLRPALHAICRCLRLWPPCLMLWLCPIPHHAHECLAPSVYRCVRILAGRMRQRSSTLQDARSVKNMASSHAMLVVAFGRLASQRSQLRGLGHVHRAASVRPRLRPRGQAGGLARIFWPCQDEKRLDRAAAVP